MVYSVGENTYYNSWLHVLLFTMLNVLYHYISAFRSMCAVPNMAVCCSPLISCFSGMLLRYCLNDTEMAPVAPVVTGIFLVFTFHMRCISIVRSIYIYMYICIYIYMYIYVYIYIYIYIRIFSA